jgi:hypothetical protein
MFYSYIGGEHKNMLVRFFIHQINAPKFFLLSLKSFVAEKRHGAMQKLFIKKNIKKKRVEKKWTSVQDI